MMFYECRCYIDVDDVVTDVLVGFFSLGMLYCDCFVILSVTLFLLWILFE